MNSRASSNLFSVSKKFARAMIAFYFLCHMVDLNMSKKQVFPVVQPSEFQVNLAMPSCPCTQSDCGCGVIDNPDSTTDSCKSLNSAFTLFQTQDDPNLYRIEYDSTKPAGVKTIELLFSEEGDDQESVKVACVTVRFEDTDQPSVSWIRVGIDDYRNIGSLRSRNRSSFCCMPKSVTVNAPPEPDYCAPHRDWQSGLTEDLNEAMFFPSAGVAILEDSTETPVRFMNGQLNERINDIGSNGYGLPWGQTRIYNNRLANNYDYGCGMNWMIHEQPMLVIHERKFTDDNDQEWVNRAIAVVRGPRNSLWFDEDVVVKSDEPFDQWSSEKRIEWDSLSPRFGQQHQLVHFADEGLFRLIAPNGQVWEFNDFEYRAEPSGALNRKHANWTPGRLKRHLGQGRQETLIEYEQGTGLLKNIRRKVFRTQEITERFTFEYIDEGENFGRIRSVALTRTGHPEAHLNGNIQKVVYSYYGTCDDAGEPLTKGQLGDLRFAAIQIPDRDSNGVWKNLSIHYYTYAIDHESYKICSTPEEAPIWKVQQFAYQQGLLEKIYSPEQFRAVYSGSVPDHGSHADLLEIGNLPSNEDWIETLEKQLDEGDNDQHQHLEIKYDDERRVNKITDVGSSRDNEFGIEYKEKTRDFQKLTEPYNTVRYRTIVTRSDDVQTKFFSNLVGQPLGRKQQHATSTSEGKICEAWVYHPTTGNLLRSLAGNAVLDVIDYPDEDDNLTVYLSGDGVLGIASVPANTLTQSDLEVIDRIEVRGVRIHVGSPPADDEGAGGLVLSINYFDSAPGQRVATHSLRRLNTNEDHFLTLYKYAANPLNVNFGLGPHEYQQTIPLIETVFRPIDTIVNQEKFDYQWNQARRPGTSANENSPAMKERKITLPAVPASQNGDNQAGVTTELFNEYGYMYSSTDARNTEGYPHFDIPTGCTYSITESVGDIGRVTKFEFDRFGRVVKTIGPKIQAVTDPSSLDTEEVDMVRWTQFKDLEGETWMANGYRKADQSEVLVNPIQVERINRNGQSLESISCKLPTPAPLTGSESVPAKTHWVNHSQKYYDHLFRVIEDRIYTSIQQDLYLSTRITEYDPASRPKITVDPSATKITKIYNALNQVTEIKIGNDNPRTVQKQTYNALGLPQRTDFLTNSDTDGRYIVNAYDWRGRKWKTYSGTDTVVINNYGDRVVDVPLEVEHFAIGQESISAVQRKLDVRGRVYQVEVRGNRIFPDDSDNPNQAESTLIEKSTYDQNGNLELRLVGADEDTNLKHQQWLKYRATYDSLNRPTRNWTERLVTTRPFAGGQPTHKTTIVEDTTTKYELTDQPIDISRTRHDNNSEVFPKSLSEQIFAWSDPLGRNVATAFVGSNGQANRPTSIPARSETALVSQQFFNDRGELELTRSPDYISGTAGKGELKRTYDDAARVVEQIEAHGSSMARTVNYTYHSSSQVQTMTLSNPHTGNQTTTYQYGTTGATAAELVHGSRLAKIIYPNLSEKTFKYNRQGDVFEMKDPNQSVHKFEYNGVGKLTSETIETLGAGVDGRVRRIGLDYDSRGRLRTTSSYSDTQGHTTVNQVIRTYDDFGNVKIERQGHDGTIDMLAFSQVFEASDYYGPKLESVFYPGGILYSVEHGSAVAGNHRRKLEYQYDETKHHPVMQLATEIRHKLFLPAQRVDLAQQQYSDNGEPVKSIALLNKTALLRDELHNLRHSEDFASDFGAYDSRDSMGRQDRIDTEQITSNGSFSSQLLVPFKSPFSITFDRASNVRRKSRSTWDLQIPHDQAMKYDAHNRLIYFGRGSEFDADGTIRFESGEIQFDHDSADNRKRININDQQSVTEGFDDNFLGSWQDTGHNSINRIISLPDGLVSQDDPIYDANGNMTRMPDPMDPRRNLHCTYDAWNRMVKVHRSAAPGATNPANEFVAEYWYDGLGRRIVKHTGGVYMHFYYDSAGRVIEERQSDNPNQPDGLVNRQYIWGLDGRLLYVDHGENHPNNNGDQTRLVAREYLAYDQLGSVGGVLRTEYDSNGRISAEHIRYYDYEPYGRPKLLNGTPFRTFQELGTGSNEDDYLFAGYRYDRETGLYNTHFRQYHPWLGVWTGPDPAGYHDSLNLYQYALSNPAKYVDPSGGYVESLWDAASLGIGLWSFAHNVKQGKGWHALVDVIGIVADTAALALPLVPGGVGTAIRAARQAKILSDTYDATKHARMAVNAFDAASDAAKVANFALNIYETHNQAQQGNYFAAALSALGGAMGAGQLTHMLGRRGLGVNLRWRRTNTGAPLVEGYNCPFCTVAGLTGKTSSEIAQQSGKIESSLVPAQIDDLFMQIFKLAPGSGHKSFKNIQDAIAFMNTHQVGTKFGFAYRHLGGGGHIIAGFMGTKGLRFKDYQKIIDIARKFPKLSPNAPEFLIWVVNKS